MRFEDKLMGGIPLAEAATFFIKVKTGSAPTTEIEEDTHREKTAALSTAAPSFDLQSYLHSPVVKALVVAGSHTVGGALGYHVGKGMAQEGEEYPEVGLGTVAGGLLLPGGLGYIVGKRIGHSSEANKQREGEHKKKTSSVADRFAAGLRKLADANFGSSPEMTQFNPGMEAGIPPQGQQAEQPPMPKKPAGAGELQQMMAEEQEGAAAQEQAEASFYRQKAEASSQAAQAMQQQIGQLSQQTQQLQQQLDASQAQIQTSMQQAQMAQQAALSNVQQAHAAASQSTSQALQSMEEVLRQKQLAAAMRMGTIQLKDQVMGALAQDPTEQLASQLQSPPPGGGGPAPGQGAPPGQPGDLNAPAEQQADPSAAQTPGPTTAAPESPAGESAGAEAAPAPEPAPKKEGGGGKTTVTVHAGEKKASMEQIMAKAANRLPFALAGAAMGAGLGHLASRTDNEGLRGKIKDLESQEDSFGQAFSLAQAKMRLALGEAAEKHPGAAMGVGAAMGGISGATSGPKLMSGISRFTRNNELVKHLEGMG